MPAVHIVFTSTLRTESGAEIRDRWAGARMHTHTRRVRFSLKTHNTAVS